MNLVIEFSEHFTTVTDIKDLHKEKMKLVSKTLQKQRLFNNNYKCCHFVFVSNSKFAVSVLQVP